jgi:NADPH2:quinone reductase
MKAVLSRAVGGPEKLVVEEIANPAARKGEVLIAVAACGVNYPDSLIIEDRYQFKPQRPFSPGGEIAGVVEAVGEGVTHVKPGQRVLASTGWGGMAEKIAVEARRCLAIPDAMPFDEAAAFLMTYGTSYYALVNRGALKAGETLLVLGAGGGVGSAAVELGKAMGARVIAAASSPEKVEAAKSWGADEGLGFPAGIPKLPLNLTLLKSCQVVGVFWGAFATRDPEGNARNAKELFALYQKGAIKPRISKHFPLDQAGAAIAWLAGRHALGKVVVTVP